ncbi:hypothetical protein [Mucilaginibacter psychrotolerans]|uniref:Outer membrane protein beta-barrel domain-containing protein n=1 Tax=Mucilaginibacter psychrotolerans TaxID=1524096 RepID=A0A4Y8S8J9_9SPHI|nr:hypothetical protein [Mucilaginibacter psychrotolerans]TFF34940.1 hypothetical protein E2R66_20435 [Mucilaginibacter psychrotolerans]
MMKKLLTVALVLIGFYAQAQERTTVFERFTNQHAIGIGVTGYLPSGNVFKTGYGASVKSEWPIAQDLSITGTVGIAQFNYKRIFNEELQPTKAATFVPITVGAKYFLGEELYFEGNFGGGFASGYPRKDGFFTVELSAGYQWKLSKTGSLDTSVGYLNWGNNDNLKVVAFKVAYRVQWF